MQTISIPHDSTNLATAFHAAETQADFLGGLLQAGSNEDFFAQYFARQPMLGRLKRSLALGESALFALLPRVHERQQLRFLSAAVDEHGMGEVQLQALDPDGLLDKGQYRTWFLRNRVSFALQEFELYCQYVQTWYDALGNLLDCRVSTTTFISPPASQATAIHYDKSDVFALQVHGSKTWHVYRPIDHLPNSRTPDQPIAEGGHGLVHFASYTLQPGDFLYLPRGWIHRVENHGQQMSVHVSMVAFFDSWLAVFGNLMAEAYACMRDDWQLRQHVTPQGLRGDSARSELAHMMQRFQCHFSQLAQEDLPIYLDHCLNRPQERQQQALARSSFEAVGDSDVRFVMSKVHYLVRENGKRLKLSSDGMNFYGVPKDLFVLVKGEPTVTLEQLMHKGVLGDEIILNFVEVTVKKLGIFILQPVVSAANDMVVEMMPEMAVE